MIFNLFKKKPIKFCENCKWFEIANNSSFPERCMRPIVDNKTEHKLIYSQKTIESKAYPLNHFCVYQRENGLDYCGKEAKYFEAKE